MKISTYTTLKKKTTLTKLYSRFDEITEENCNNLFVALYNNSVIYWINPLTTRKIHKASDISISFLSKCYYFWGDKTITIGKHTLTYKEHIEKFIDKEFLYDVRPLIPIPTPISPPGARMNLPKSNSPPKIGRIPAPAAPAAPAAKKASPMGAATNKPKSPPQPVPVTPHAAAANLKKPIRFSSKSANARHDKNSVKLDEGLCLEFVNNIKDTIQKTKTSAELRGLKFENPVTGNLIGIESPILRSFLSKCYYSFNKKNMEIKNIIEEIIDITDLIEEEKIVAPNSVINAKTNAINSAIDNAIEKFHKCCDELAANCDANGIILNHNYISNVVNSIMNIIHIRYMHLGLLNANFVIKDKKALEVYMYDEAFKTYFEEKHMDPTAIFIKYNDINRIIYQKNDLLVQNVISELSPKTLEYYYTNRLFNRQYLFEYPIAPVLVDKVFAKGLLFNKINFKFLPELQYPDSLYDAKEAFINAKPVKGHFYPFNYNITNSTLPKYIYTNGNNEISKYFNDIINMVNIRLQSLPLINGIAEENTQKKAYYDVIIQNMRNASYGDNETDYGSDDMIRKNILYSLNAQVSPFFLKNGLSLIYRKYNNDENIFYNSEFSGTFPLFTWIPLHTHNIKDTSIYNYTKVLKWQPLGLQDTEYKEIDRFYKNNGIPPWSKWLNETIYKVITNEYDSVNSIVVSPQRTPLLPVIIQSMKERITNTIGIYKNKTRNPEYNNNKIYLYHGTRNRLHDVGNKWFEDIEILGFLSTSLNMYTASFYSGIADNNSGFIYIIEVDYTQTYINLNDDLKQFLLLPYSRIKVLAEFNFGYICVILCRLFRTPSIDINNKLYNKLLGTYKPTSADINKYVSYRIKANNNEMPVCAFMISKFWRRYEILGTEDMLVYRIGRNKLNNKRISNASFSSSKLKEEYIYFSLGQEYQIYVERGLQLNLGSFEDIKYSVHQHFIKDCYKALGIPCIDYIFIHSPFINNAITTGILLKEYKNNIIDHYKYDVNNFLIDCIFKFNSLKNTNKMLDIIDDRALDSGMYVDKIEGFRDAGLYCNGAIDQVFNKQSEVGEDIQYLRDWKHLFAKYKDASDDDLNKHFIWCNNRIERLIEIIKTTKEHYLKFINEILVGKMKDTSINKKGVLDAASKEAFELNMMIATLSDILLSRAEFYKKATNSSNVKMYIDMIRRILDEEQNNIHNSKLYKNPVLADLILEEKRKSDVLTGGIHSMKDIMKMNEEPKRRSTKAANAATIDHQKLYEMFKNVPIQESKDMRKYADMPEQFKEYYKGAVLDKDGYFDISDHCYCRPVKKV